MKLFRRIHAYYLLLTRFAIFKFRHPAERDFWEWLFKRIYCKDSRDYRNNTLAAYLVLQALEEEEHFRAAWVFRDFETEVSPLLGENAVSKLTHSLFFAEVREQFDGNRRSVLEIVGDQQGTRPRES